MRITVHLDTFNEVDASAFVILWLDDELDEWSREAHSGISPPAWGRLRSAPGKTLICGPDGREPIFELEGLELHQCDGPFEGEAGIANWFAPDADHPASGHWHIQCLDDECTQPESGIFADGEA